MCQSYPACIPYMQQLFSNKKFWKPLHQTNITNPHNKPVKFRHKLKCSFVGTNIPNVLKFILLLEFTVIRNTYKPRIMQSCRDAAPTKRGNSKSISLIDLRISFCPEIGPSIVEAFKRRCYVHRPIHVCQFPEIHICIPHSSPFRIECFTPENINSLFFTDLQFHGKYISLTSKMSHDWTLNMQNMREFCDGCKFWKYLEVVCNVE